MGCRTDMSKVVEHRSLITDGSYLRKLEQPLKSSSMAGQQGTHVEPKVPMPSCHHVNRPPAQQGRLPGQGILQQAAFTHTETAGGLEVASYGQGTASVRGVTVTWLSSGIVRELRKMMAKEPSLSARPRGHKATLGQY